MLQQRRSFSSSTSDRRGRQQQQAFRPRTTSVWEVVFLVVLLILTCVNLYTYSERRERFQRARGGVDTETAAGGKSGNRRRYNGNDIESGGRGHERVPGAAAVATSAGAEDARGGGGADGSPAAPGGGVGASSTKYNIPPPSLSEATPARHIPLGRDRPLQIIAVAPGESNLQWPAAGDGGGGGSDGQGLPSRPAAAGASAALSAAEADTVGHFPCSLTEVDFAPGREARGKQQLQLQKTWPTSGPCVISCSPQSSPSSPPPPSSEGKPLSDRGRFEYCERAVRACELYQECTHVLMPATANGEVPAGGGGGGIDVHNSGSGARFATLMHQPAEDGSMAGVEAAAAGAARAAAAGGMAGGGWGGSDGGFTLDPKPRTYYVVSFGGSGSKMLGGWLSERGNDMVKKVFHIHDPRPADELFAKVARKSVSSRQTVGKGKDFRAYDFPEGDFPVDGVAVRDVDSYRVVLIFKDPAEALVSRYFYNHCRNIRGAECGETQADFPSLERYAEESNDRLHMQAFYDNYCDPATATADDAAGKNEKRGRRKRNYPVVCVNYHKMWDNKEALVRALGLPVGEALKLPERTETVRNDQTSAARGEPFTLAVRERLRRKHASLSEKVFGSPAVAIV